MLVNKIRFYRLYRNFKYEVGCSWKPQSMINPICNKLAYLKDEELHAMQILKCVIVITLKLRRGIEVACCVILGVRFCVMRHVTHVLWRSDSPAPAPLVEARATEQQINRILEARLRGAEAKDSR